MNSELILIDLGDALTETKQYGPPVDIDNAAGQFGLV